MASPKNQLSRLRGQISRAKVQDGERLNDLIESGSSLLAGAAIGTMRGMYVKQPEGDWNVKGTKIPIELVTGVLGLGLGMFVVKTGPGNAAVLGVANTSLAVLAARKSEISARKKAAEKKAKG